MHRCDILLVPSREDAMWKCEPEADTTWLVFPITPEGGRVYDHFFKTGCATVLGRANSWRDTKKMRRIIRYARAPKRNLTVNTYFMDSSMAEINARYFANKAEEKRIASEAAELFGPLLELAIIARHKHEITNLIRNYPATVEKSFIIMRLRNDFPELKEPGVTLDNWHLHGEGSPETQKTDQGIEQNNAD